MNNETAKRILSDENIRTLGPVLIGNDYPKYYQRWRSKWEAKTDDEGNEWLVITERKTGDAELVCSLDNLLFIRSV